MQYTKKQLKELCRLYDSDIPFKKVKVDEKEMERFRKLVESIKKKQTKQAEKKNRRTGWLKRMFR